MKLWVVDDRVLLLMEGYFWGTEILYVVEHIEQIKGAEELDGAVERD